MQRTIIGFHQDEAQAWVADFACGHQQHVRHMPPWLNRPWVLSPEGRRSRLGYALECTHCEPGAEERGPRTEDARPHTEGMQAPQRSAHCLAAGGPGTGG